MSSIGVTLFRDFHEDHRASMEIYADGLGEALQAGFSDRCHAREYRPQLNPRFGDGTWAMRLARYVSYPSQARRCQGSSTGTINHVIDHGYGHLLYALDPKRTIVTVHDLIPLVRSRGGIPSVPVGSKPWLNSVSFNALRRAGHLIAASESTKRDLINLCHCNSNRISVISYGVSPRFQAYAPTEKLRVRRGFGLPSDVFCVLTLGAQFYKNQTGSLRAFAKFAQTSKRPVCLVTTAQLGTEWTELLHKLALVDRVKLLPSLAHDQMVALYNSIDCLLFPSLYEGFGWPPLEAMACGIPVVTSNAASLPEVVGPAALTCAPQDYDAIAHALHRVSTDADLRRSMVEQGLVRSQQFTWETAARKTLAVYETVAASFEHSDN